ncbi:hypothetical protein F511_36142 [Dorcoceras hygrometricum]|uniref:Uncharacterized protein n=1 Tax=Dorcoceras hygrometricum TaxID=472368 RepID=A0A2Z7AZP0_9LAMI|nr:hypothetical protein F511_36142 [Dorcoceras hygrometricum]
MAASLIHNALQVNFDSVLSFPDEGMDQMFKALESTGLRGFLDCPSVLYEQDLEIFFSNATVHGDSVISCVQSKFVGIFEEFFAGSFELPTEGFTSMDEVPKDLIYDARSVFSASGEPIKTSCKKKEMKIEFRLLNDILAKYVSVKAGSLYVSVKAGSFDARVSDDEKSDDEDIVEQGTDKERISVEQPTVEEIVEEIVAKVLSNEEGPLVETYKEKEKEKETEKEAADKRKKVENILDSEDTEPLSKVLELTETSMSDEESMSIDDILRQILEEMMLPSVMAEEPTKICLCRLSVLESVSDIAAKEEQVLLWAEIDSLQTAVRSRLYITVKYREMLLRKFLEARHQNFESGTPTIANDIQVLDLLSDAHRISLKYLLEQMRQHKLEWTRPCSSKLFERANVQSEGIHYRFYPSIKSTNWVLDSSRGYKSLVEMQVQVSYFSQEEAATTEAILLE